MGIMKKNISIIRINNISRGGAGPEPQGIEELKAKLKVLSRLKEENDDDKIKDYFKERETEAKAEAEEATAKEVEAKTKVEEAKAKAEEAAAKEEEAKAKAEEANGAAEAAAAEAAAAEEAEEAKAAVEEAAEAKEKAEEAKATAEAELAEAEKKLKTAQETVKTAQEGHDADHEGKLAFINAEIIKVTKEISELEKPAGEGKSPQVDGDLVNNLEEITKLDSQIKGKLKSFINKAKENNQDIYLLASVGDISLDREGGTDIEIKGNKYKMYNDVVVSPQTMEKLDQLDRVKLNKDTALAACDAQEEGESEPPAPPDSGG